MHNLKLTVTFSVIVVLSSACTQSAQKLELDNILDLKAERALRAEAKAASRVKIEEEEVKTKKDDAKKKEAEIFAVSQQDPAELALLELPEIFLLSASKSHALQHRGAQKPIATVWRARNLNVTIMAWKNPTNAEKIRAMSKDELRAELNQVGKQYDDFFQQTRKSHATFKIKEEDNHFMMKIKSNYLNFEEWFTQSRYILFYRPDYRLNLVIIGKDEDLAKVNSDLEESIELFRARLRKRFKKGIKSSAEQVDGTNQKAGV